MRHAEKNEIDLLLRDLAEGEGPETVESGTAGAEAKHGSVNAHLDVDELNSFAEGVLPATTRSLYVAHLADCPRCRRIVAQLATASAAELQQVRTEEAAKSGLWTYLANFFNASVLRYAVPVLGVLVLAAIGLLWLRQDRQAEFVARNKQVSPALQAARDNAATTNESATSSAVSKNNDLKHAAAKAGESRQERKSSTENETAASGTEKKEEKAEVPAAAVAQPSAAREPAANEPPSKPKAAVAGEVARNEVEQRRQPTTADTAEQREAEKRGRRDKDEETSKKAGAAVGNVTPANRRAIANQESATRTVGGRRFKRDGNVWVDTAYDSSQTTTNVTRGSEQYRALLGDEPGLRIVAEQLEGEVIVIWKGKAYRFR